MWPNSALSDLVRSWSGMSIGDSMRQFGSQYEDVLEH